MPYTLAALYDAASEASLYALRRQLAAYAGINASSVTRPHLSLAIVNELDAEALRPSLEAFCQTIPPLPVHMAAVGTFPTGEGVVFIAPVVTRPLLAAHAQLYQLLDGAGFLPTPFYRPQNWVPHCTVAINLASEQLGGAIKICCQADVYHTDQLTQLALIEFPPMRTLYSLPLRGHGAPSELVG